MVGGRPKKIQVSWHAKMRVSTIPSGTTDRITKILDRPKKFQVSWYAKMRVSTKPNGP